MVRIAVVDKQKCRAPHDCNYICEPLCPVNKTGGVCIEKDEFTNKIKIVEETCIGCNICVNKCPFGAIQIINLPEMLNADPVHRYGENQFALFNMPVPMFGKVVGILGKNGIGKSTAIKIIAGLVKSNLGDWTKEAEHKEIVEHFKGTPAHKFFEDQKAGKITVSYKPQHVELIPHQFDGKISELLNKVNENGKLDYYVEKLDLTNIMDRDISKISGGELQRVAICAALLKKANVYIFDEPTSYLDIKQRMKVSDLIRELVDNETAVMVIEHDLLVLDYVADLLYLMYGNEGGYGIVSSVKSIKEGINTYLLGFIKEDNMRFRDHAIKFDNAAQDAITNLGTLTDWNDLVIEQGNFKLEAKSGEIEVSNILGILGQNGIGKTTFMKALAGVSKPTTGTIGKDLKVSYKPQYLQADSEINVMELLATEVKDFGSETYVYNFESPLNLKPLYDKKLNELSGGELQRLSIAMCLAKDADIYLLDEPSAYLDVEQRLVTSKLIKDRIMSMGKTVLIIDHDLLFIDYLCKRIMIFDGQPAVSGFVHDPVLKVDGLNNFLKILEITVRRDEENNRPRINKKDSVMDKKQRSENRYYYI